MGVLIASIAIIIPFALAQGRTSVYYALFDALPQDMPGIVGVSKLGEDFGMVTNHFILVHDDLPASKVSALCDDIGELDGITQVVSLDAITGPASPPRFCRTAFWKFCRTPVTS